MPKPTADYINPMVLELTEADIGKWYRTRGGQYVQITGMSPIRDKTAPLHSFINQWPVDGVILLSDMSHRKMTTRIDGGYSIVLTAKHNYDLIEEVTDLLKIAELELLTN